MTPTPSFDQAVQFAISNAPMILWTIDAQGIVTSSTGQGMARQGLSAGKVVGSSIFTLYAHYPVFLENIRKALAGDSVQFVLETFDGVFNRRLEPLRDKAGAVIGVVGVAVDVTEAYRAREALARSEEQFRNLVEGSLQGIAIARDQKVLFANDSIARTFGYANAEAFLRDFKLERHFSPEMVARIRQNVQRRVTGEPVDPLWQTEGTRLDGSFLSLEVLARAVSWEGAPAVQVVFYDITARKLADARLRHSEEQFRSLVEGSLQGMVIRRERRTIFANPAMARMLGYDRPEELVALANEQIMPPWQVEQFTRERHLERDGVPIPTEFEVEFIRRDGSNLSCLAMRSPVTWEGEPATQITLVDITERKQAEAHLRQREEQFRALTEGSLQGIVIHRDRKFLFVNQAYARLLGFDSPEQVYALATMDAIVAPEERERLKAFSRMRLAGQPVPEMYETVSLRTDGRRVYVLVSSRIVQWQGQPAIQSTLVDITERKKAEQALQESEWQLSRAQQAAHIGTWYRELATGLTRWSDEFYRLLGLQPGAIEASTENFYGVVHPEDLAGYQAVRNSALEAQGHLSMEVRVVRPDQSIRLMRIVADRVDSEEGRPKALVGTLEDITDRRAAEAALRQSEERYRDIVEGSLQGITITQDFRYHFANTAFLRMLGYGTLEELQAEGTTLDRVAPYDRERVKNTVAEMLAGKPVPPVVSFDCVRRDGSTFTVLSLYRTITLNDRPATQVTLVDVSEQRAAENALRQSEQRYRDLVEGSLQGIIITQGFQYRFANPAYLRMFGFKNLGEMQAAGSSLERIAPYDRERVQANVKARLAGQNVPTTFEFDCIRKDGSIFTVLSLSSIILWEGQPAGLVTLVDITEQRNLQSSLRLKDHAIQSANEAIAFGDLSGRILEVNRAFVKMWGLASADEAVGRRGIEFWWMSGDVEQAAGDLRRDGRWAGETTAKRANGEIFPVEVRVSTVLDDKRKPVWLMASIVDITERKEVEERQRGLEEQLFQAQKMESIGRLVGGIAHDFNNMLTPMLGYAELALAQMDPQHASHRHIRIIQSAAERAADLTRKMLMFGRRRPLRKVSVDIAAELQNVVDMLQRVIHESIAIDTQFARDLGQTEADPALVHQLIMNLALNARDAMPRGGRLTIAADRCVFASQAACPPELTPGTYIRMLVQDTGEGMEADILGRIFDPFFTTKPEGKGTGLGLSVVYGIVKQHGGNISVSSKVGAGTTFVVHLPAPAALTLSTREEPQPMPARRSATILVVEDDPQVLGLVSAILGGQGYTLLEANGPAAALQVLSARSAAVDLLLCDVVMPEMSGPELSKRVTAKYPSTRVLFMSGYAKDLIEHQGLAGSGSALLDKPFSVDQLTRAVRGALDRP